MTETKDESSALAAQGLALAALIIQTHGKDQNHIVAFIQWGGPVWAFFAPAWLPRDDRGDFSFWVGAKIVRALTSDGFKDQGPEKFLAWTRKIARHEAINRTRQHDRATLGARVVAEAEDKRLATAAGRYLHGLDRELERPLLAAEQPDRSQRARALVQAILESPVLNDQEKLILREDLLGTSNAKLAVQLALTSHRISQLRHAAHLKARRYLKTQGIAPRDFGWSPQPKKATSPSVS